ncbi:MAG: metal ABC transporter ATP-binding protein [Alphaproteobacteria bacterium]
MGVEITPPRITLEGLTLGYERHPAVHHLHGAFPAGTMTAVIGPNGAGKSTLLKGVMGLLRPMEGRVVLSGLDRREIAYLPQQAEIDVDFPISVLDTVLLGLWRHLGAFHSATDAMLDRAREALSAVGLDGFESRSVGSLSSGQRQRVLFARVLVADSPVILLDEPFTAVDTKTTADLLNLVVGWHGEGRIIVAVLHDHEQVYRHFPQTLLLAREAIDWGDTDRVLTDANLRKAREMCEAWDAEAPVCLRGSA